MPTCLVYVLLGDLENILRITLNRRRRIPKNKSCRLGLVLSDDGKGFQTRSIEVVKLIDLLDEAKTPKATLVERDYKLVSTRLNVIDKCIEVVKLIDMLNEAKTPKATLVER
nr:arginine--tRNA ligase, cytoplasmic-like isoform X1 [Tanacetum cinerariifolium]